MTAFCMLSAYARAIFALWALLLCLANIGNAVLAAVRRRYRFTAAALLLFAPIYAMWQVIFDLSLCRETDQIVNMTRTLCAFAWGYWLLACVLFTLGTALLLGVNIHYDKTNITPGAIKLYLDKIPCGICCWRENGRVLFSNNCMNELCVAITHQMLLNGNQFRSAVKEDILSVEGKVWRFASRPIFSDGERLYEMIASDITSEYAKTRALEKDKAELSRLNQELWEYYLSIDESVQRREILQAKMNIHDEMNRLMLSTMAADSENIAQLDRIFSLWEQNALLLCMEAEEKTLQQKSGAVDSLAGALGVQVIWRNTLPAALSEKQKELFFFTAQEAVVNAVKHAQAKTVEISFEHTEDAVVCRLVNDGAMPQGRVSFAGGLANLSSLAKKQGAELCMEAGEKFTLALKFPKNEKK